MIWKLLKSIFASEPNSSVTEDRPGEEAALEGPPEGFVEIPNRPYDPSNGDFQTVWKPLLELEHVLFPVFLSLDQNITPETARPLKMSDLDQKILYVQSDVFGNGALQPFNVFYSDPRLLQPGTMCQQMKPGAYLEHILYDPNSVGVAFNPSSRVMKRVLEEDTLYINKIGIAELVGFLQVGEAEPRDRPYSELAKDAFRRELYFQALYFWAKCYRGPRPGDSWQECYLEKLKAYYVLDFPGSRERAASELAWYMNEHGGTVEHSTLMANWGIG